MEKMHDKAFGKVLGAGTCPSARSKDRSATRINVGFPLAANDRNPRSNPCEIIFPRRSPLLEELALRMREEIQALGFDHLERRAAR